jgi:predicted phage terminase large subunit-like protein
MLSSSSSSSPAPDLPGGIPLSVEAYKAEVRRRAQERMAREAHEHAAEIRERCRTLHGFVKEAWGVLEPEAKFSDNWHIELICKHLEAVTRGEITRLLINVWPGSMKSLIVSVLWQAWEWGPAGRPSLRNVSTSFNDKPVNRDTTKTRDLVMSEWYRTLWPEVVLKKKGETSFTNTDTGGRIGVAFGSLTSQRGDRLIIDDPHSTETAESDVERAKTTRKFLEGAVNRLNDQARSAIVVIMQRLHQDDMSGVIMKHPKLGYVHIVLPMEFEPKRAYRSRWGSDPRTIRGELADPVRFPRSEVEKLKDSGDYFWAGQYQQRPSPREGGLFKIPEDWQTSRVVDKVPLGGITVGAWDFAGSKRKKSPYTVRAKMTAVGMAIYVRHVDRRRTLPHELDAMIEDVVIDDGHNCFQSLPQDPGQAGKHQKWRIAEQLDGYDFRITPETGDKETRAEPYSAQWNVGRVFLVRGPWNDAYIDELRNFPNGSYKDQVDASSRAHMEIVRLRNRDSGDGVAGPRIPEAANG